ncbi:MAG: hypothetical protein BGO31_15960 [Bacteroidetes bacterium 43-16]|nr:MAG: hypothetical protein BGO31_15960 [Bacteroidetes bacterium 43-16]
MVGLGIQTLYMFVSNAMGLPITAISTVIFSVVALIFFGAGYYYQTATIPFGKKYFAGFSFSKDIGSVNVIWLLSFAFTVYIVYIISLKSLFWPTYAHDALTSFDLFAKGIAREETLLNSLIMEKRVGPGAAYPPFYSLGVAYFYQIGYENANTISVLFLVFFTISFYAVSRVLLHNSTSAAFFTFMAISIPEFIGQSAINITSCPQAMMVSLSIACFMIWFNQRARINYLNLSAVLMGLAGFLRSETVVYMLPVFTLLAGLFLFKKGIKPAAVARFIILAVLPLALWQIFLKLNAGIMEKFVQIEFSHSFDSQQLATSGRLMSGIIFSAQFFGITPYIGILSLILSLIALKWGKKDLLFFSLICITFALYLLLVNQMKLKFDSMENIIQFSGKRFLFGMAILIWLSLASNRYISLLFDKLHRSLSRKKTL